jgi:flagellar hook-basal body complex protein FliE
MNPLALASANAAPLTVTVSPQAASNAYLSAGMDDLAAGGENASGFGATLQRAIEGAIGTGHDADRKSMQAIAGKGNITDVVTAVSKAQLSLQSAVAIRDKVVSAYQEIMRMAI